MTSFKKFWQRIETLASPVDSFASWRIRLADSLAEGSKLLILVNRLAGSVPHPVFHQRRLTVIHHSFDSIVGVHEESGEVVPLNRQDVLVYQIDGLRVCDWISKAMGLEGMQPKQLTEIAHCFRVGAYKPLTGFEFPVFLAIIPSPFDRVSVFLELAVTQEKPFILFVPTIVSVSQRDLAMVRTKQSLIIPMDESLDFEKEEGVIVTEDGQRLLDDFHSWHIPAKKSRDVTGTFFPTPSSATWSELKIGFLDGETISASVRDVSMVLHYEQLGMSSGKNAKPTKQWALLSAYARNRGGITWSQAGAGRSVKKQTQELSRKLRNFFRIEGSPIEFDKSTKGYRTVFQIEGDN